MEAALLTCLLNWALPDRLFYHRRSPIMVCWVGPARQGSRTGTRCILPCSSTAWSDCPQAAWVPSRHMSRSGSRGSITGITAWSSRAGHRQDIVLPVFLVCTIPHPLTRTSSVVCAAASTAENPAKTTIGH